MIEQDSEWEELYPKQTVYQAKRFMRMLVAHNHIETELAEYEPETKLKLLYVSDEMPDRVLDVGFTTKAAYLRGIRNCLLATWEDLVADTTTLPNGETHYNYQEGTHTPITNPANVALAKQVIDSYNQVYGKQTS